jgi:peptidoglycan-associated lipoprotein
MKNKSVFLLGITVLLSLFVLLGCPKKAEVPATPEPETLKSELTTTPTVTAAAPEPVKEVPQPEVKDAAKEQAAATAAAVAAGLYPIYFDFDRSFVRDDAKAALKATVELLKANPRMKIRIEGNCDERGTKEYNQALGQRRATSAKKYLTDMGISAKRISLISYGKEKPVCSESNEDCWQKNRRDDFVKVSK